MGKGERLSDRHLSGWARYLQKTNLHVRYPAIKPSLENSLMLGFDNTENEDGLIEELKELIREKKDTKNKEKPSWN